MAFYQKYRPQQFNDVIGQDHISKTLMEAIKNDRLSHAYLLTGPRGTGKTTTARLLAKAINCPEVNKADEKGGKAFGEPCNQCLSCSEISDGRSLDVIEIDAASHTGVDDIRELIGMAMLAPASAKKKVYIIDEVHMLSKSAFNALLKTLEEPPAHVVFILATTEVHKLPETILSRTQRYDFKRITKDNLIIYLRRVAEAEKLEIDDKSLDLIALMAHGAHRDALSLMEQVAGYTTKITASDVESILGLVSKKEVFKLLWAIFNKSSEEGLKIAHRLSDQGYDIAIFHHDLVEALRKIILYKVSGSFLFEDTQENLAEIEKIASGVPTEQLVAMIKVLLENGRLLKEVANPLLPIEMSVVELIGLGNETKGKEVKAEVKLITNVQPVNSPKEKDSKIVDSKPVINKTNSSNQPLSPGYMDQKTPAVPVKNLIEKNDEAPVLEMTGDIWQQVLAVAKKQNSTLAALLRDAKPLIVESGSVVLGVKFQFHKDKISEEKNRQILESIFTQVTGSATKVACQIVNGQLTPAPPATDEELQQAVTEIFEVEG